MKRFVSLLVLVAVVAVASCPAWATAVTLPETGVDISGGITAAVVALGAIIATVMAAWFAFLLIRKGLAWARKVGS